MMVPPWLSALDYQSEGGAHSPQKWAPQRGVPGYRLRLLRGLVLGFLVERLPDGLVADESLFVRRQLARRHVTRMAVGNLGGGLFLLAHAHLCLQVRKGVSGVTGRRPPPRRPARRPSSLRRWRRARSGSRA